MLIRIVLILLLTISANVLADARTGDFMGYQLGSRYQRSSGTELREGATGNLFITTEQPVKPDDIAVVTVLTTPATLTIGSITASQWFSTEEEARSFGRRYFGLLRGKYPDWPYGWEVMDARMNIVEVNFNQSPYNLQLWLSRDLRDGKNMWQFSMMLRWLPDSENADAWRKLAAAEQIAVSKAATQKMLKESDVRGL